MDPFLGTILSAFLSIGATVAIVSRADSSVGRGIYIFTFYTVAMFVFPAIFNIVPHNILDHEEFLVVYIFTWPVGLLASLALLAAVDRIK